MNEIMKRRLVGAGVLATALLVFAVLFFKKGDETTAQTEQSSDLADMRSYAIDVPVVPEQPTQEILAEGPPIGTLLPAPDQKQDEAKPPAKAKRKPAETTSSKPKPVPTTAVATPVPDVGWSVQVGSFASRQNADGLLKKLKDKGYPAFVYRNAAENPPLFRVRVGPYTHETEARSAADTLRGDLRLDVKVVANG
jgi:DedD protein